MYCRSGHAVHERWGRLGSTLATVTATATGTVTGGEPVPLHVDSVFLDQLVQVLAIHLGFVCYSSRVKRGGHNDEIAWCHLAGSSAAMAPPL